MHADDTKLYMDFSDSEENSAKVSIQSCVQDIMSGLRKLTTFQNTILKKIS